MKPRHRFPKNFLADIRHHLSRGRDVADIAIRTNKRISVIREAIKQAVHLST